MTIREAIKDFFSEMQVIHHRNTFTLASLTAYVRGIRGESFSPESAGRTLRKLRRDGFLNYAVLGNGDEYIIL